MSRIDAVNLAVPSALSPELCHFYAVNFGMREMDVDDQQRVGFKKYEAAQLKRFAFASSPESCSVMFLSSPHVLKMTSPTRDSIYWKIGLALEDVDASGEAHAKNGGCWQGAAQFVDVGYLGFTTDPAGFSVEFLQTTFEENVHVREQRKLAAGSEGPLAQRQDPVVGQITVRVASAQRSVAWYQDVLGMRLLCIEPVPKYNFDLYFLAFTLDTPPVPDDLRHISNREWLYQRPYTTLEIQHRTAGSQSITNVDLEPGMGGFESISVCVGLEKYLELSALMDSDGVVRDPDGMKVRVGLAKAE